MFNCLTKEEQEQAIKEMYKKFGMEYKGNHQVVEPKNLLFKDFKPKYPKIELLWEENGNLNGTLCYYNLVRHRYGNRQVLSYVNYEDTRTTSVWIGGVMGWHFGNLY